MPEVEPHSYRVLWCPLTEQYVAMTDRYGMRVHAADSDPEHALRVLRLLLVPIDAGPVRLPKRGKQRSR